jgi:hypothetical protein
MSYIAEYAQPLLVLCAGSIILGFVAYINWYGDIKSKSVKWIKQKVFRAEPGSDASANSLFMNVTIIILLIGFLWVGLALGYLIR